MKILITSDLHGDLNAIKSFTKSLVNYDCGIIAGDIQNEMIPEDERNIYLDKFSRDDLIPFLPDADMTFDEEIDYRLSIMHDRDKNPLIEALYRREQDIKDILCEAEKPIFLIPGNHDNTDWEDYRYITNVHNKKVKFQGFNIVGYRWTNMKRGPRDQKNDAEYLRELVDDKTIFITHNPPSEILDRSGIDIHPGSIHLLKLSTVVKAHIFGHVHSCAGNKGKYINASFSHYRKFYSLTI